MGAKIHPAIRERARELWEDEGYSPEEILDALSLALAKGELRVPVPESKSYKVTLPEHRTVINKWSKKDGWKDRLEARKKANKKIDQDIDAGQPFAISGITDPIWHLSIVEVQRYIAGLEPPSGEFAVFLHGKNDGLDKSDSELVSAAMARVNVMLRPGHRVLIRLRPVILHEIKKVRGLYQWFEKRDRRWEVAEDSQYKTPSVSSGQGHLSNPSA